MNVWANAQVGVKHEEYFKIEFVQNVLIVFHLDFMYIDREACVRNCPEGKTDVEGVCKQCVGPCPKGLQFYLFCGRNIEVVKYQLVFHDSTRKWKQCTPFYKSFILFLKVCPGTGDTYLSNYNIESFKGCTIIQGNLYIAQTTFKKWKLCVIYLIFSN